MYYLQIALLGVIFGCVYALSATGIVLTYTTTGVFNIAHFAIALLSAYLLWQLNGVWDIPLIPAAAIVLVVCGPVLGLALERFVFRPLNRRRASSSEKLVASLGVSVMVLAIINIVWGSGVKGTNEQPVPRLFPVEPFNVGSLRFDTEQVGTIITVAVVSAGLYLLLRRTYLGVRIRAVVDRRELAELAVIDSNRVSQIAWSLGCSLAAITGMIITQGTLEPTKIIFLGIETFSVAVVARLVSLPVAIGFGFLVMGLGRSLLDVFEPFGAKGGAAEFYQAAITNLSSIVLFGALVAFRRLDELGDTSGGSGLIGTFGRLHRSGPASRVVSAVLAAAAVAAPAVLHGADLRAAQRLLAMVVIFVSIVCITGFSGHLTLGQASIAGLGAFATARFANAWDLPVLAAMVLGSGVAMIAGLVAGYPALRRKGLFLGLTTLALALLIDRFVFNAQLFVGPPGGLTVRRPSLFGLDLSTDSLFYLFELAVVTVVLVLARNLRSGRLGRLLGAIRDSETASQSVGIDLRRAKLFVFAVSAAIAGIGGSLLVQANNSWETVTFNPIFGLFWFVAVAVCGITTVRGAILAAILYVGVPYLAKLDIQSAVGVFGLIAVFLGRLPGGLVGVADRALIRLRMQAATDEQEAGSAPPIALGLQPSAFAKRVLSAKGAR